MVVSDSGQVVWKADNALLCEPVLRHAAFPTYDHRWLRTRRVFSGKPLNFWHASDGTLQMELDCPASGSCDFCTAAPTGPGEPTCAVTRPSQEYVWLDGAPIALIEADVNWNGTLNDTNAAVKFIHPGLLGEPRRVTDSARNVVWARDIPAFGHIENLRDSEDTNDIGDAQQTVGGVTTTLNLGLPGQYQEPEGVYYNWHRFYDPQVGRYWEADPLVGVGFDTASYAYASARPTSRTDSMGLWDFPDPDPWGIAEIPTTQLNESYRVGGVVVAGAMAGEMAVAAAPAWLLVAAVAASKRNLEFDGPNKGYAHRNGRICGVRVRGGGPYLRLDIHPLPGRGATPYLHINYGASAASGTESNHFIIWPRP